jgi:uncharacterized protein with NRDE domain
MCLVALLFRVAGDAPVVVGANREEFYVRGGEPPQLFGGPVRFVGGRDPAAGGTWLGVNQHGVLVAVTNRVKSHLPAQPRSRGLLLADLLACASAAAAADLAARELGQDRYAGCNFLCADATHATVLHAGDWLRVRTLPPGIHVLTNRDVNDASDPRLGHALGWLAHRGHADAAGWVAALQELCGQRGGPFPPICLRGEVKGTVSSSIFALRQPLGQSTYLHAQGPPDVTPYQDYSYLMRELAGP